MSATLNFMTLHCARIVRLLTVIAFVPVLATTPSIVSARPSYLGFEPAYPRQAPRVEGRFAWYRLDTDSVRIMTLGVSADGRHVAVQMPSGGNPRDIDLVTALFQYMKGMAFEPARHDGVPVESRVPVLVRFRAGGVVPEVQFTIDWEGRVTDYDLYRLALEINGIEPPRLRRFPPLLSAVRRADSLAQYPYSLVRLDIDTAGRATAVEIVRTTHQGYEHQTVTACNWADFEPARVDGTPTPAPVYVLLSYFPEQSYPTPAWTAPPSDSVIIQMRLSVSVRADTLGLLAKPVPRNVFTEKFTLTEVPGASFSSAGIWAEVDTLGNARGLRVGSTFETTISRFRTLLEQLRFYPAIAMNGRPIRYMGPLEARFVGSGDVRIRFLWQYWENPELFDYRVYYQ